MYSRIVLMVVCWHYGMPFDANACVSSLVNVDWIKWMYFYGNEFEIGVNDSIFSSNEQQKVSWGGRALTNRHVGGKRTLRRTIFQEPFCRGRGQRRIITAWSNILTVRFWRNILRLYSITWNRIYINSVILNFSANWTTKGIPNSSSSVLTTIQIQNPWPCSKGRPL